MLGSLCNNTNVLNIMAKVKVELTQEQIEYNQWFSDLMEDKYNEDNSQVRDGCMTFQI